MVALDEQLSRTNSERGAQGGAGIPAGTVNYIYYNANWQAIETRTNGTANGNVTSQMVWSAAYINAAILQDAYSAGTIQPIARKYFLQDGNWNTTAIVMANPGTGVWAVTQRYVYRPYGTVTVLNADFSIPPVGTQPVVDNLYQGMTLDSVTGLYYERFRNYSPGLGVWISQDPAQYIDGANTYQFVDSSPVGAVDPSGLIGSPYLIRQGRAHDRGCIKGRCQFYRDYYYGMDLGRFETNGVRNLTVSRVENVLEKITSETGIGAEINAILSTSSLNGLEFGWQGTYYFEVRRFFFYRCGTHFEDIKYDDKSIVHKHAVIDEVDNGAAGQNTIISGTGGEINADWEASLKVVEAIGEALKGE